MVYTYKVLQRAPNLCGKKFQQLHFRDRWWRKSSLLPFAASKHVICSVIPTGMEGMYASCELTSSNLALMMVFQCLMVVIESGWQMLRMASPMLVALFRATRFSSSFFMKSLKIERVKSSDLEMDYLQHNIKKARHTELFPSDELIVKKNSYSAAFCGMNNDKAAITESWS